MYCPTAHREVNNAAATSTLRSQRDVYMSHTVATVDGLSLAVMRTSDQMYGSLRGYRSSTRCVLCSCDEYDLHTPFILRAGPRC